jgi:hypothetical protein
MKLSNIRKANEILSKIKELKNKKADLLKLGIALSKKQQDESINLSLKYEKTDKKGKKDQIFDEDGSIKKEYLALDKEIDPIERLKDGAYAMFSFGNPLFNTYTKEEKSKETFKTEIGVSECLLILDSLAKWNQTQIDSLKQQLKTLMEA